jgi:hypothetical protein
MKLQDFNKKLKQLKDNDYPHDKQFNMQKIANILKVIFLKVHSDILSTSNKNLAIINF